MDALTFLKERNRMCHTHIGQYGYCKGCPLKQATLTVCSAWCFQNPEKAITAVEQWSKEHPRKTRKSKLLEQWPNAKLCEQYVKMCPNLIDKDYMPVRGCSGTACDSCREKFWTEEIE